MANNQKYVSNVAFTDLLFNIVVGLAFLFLLAFILMNPIAKEKDIEEKSDFIIIMEWDDESGDDLDLWVRNPNGGILSFRNRGIGFMHLDRDDLGLANDKIKTADGKFKYVLRNKEVVSLRGYQTGEYLVNVHVYNKKGWLDKKYRDSSVKVQLIKLNPYEEITEATFVASKKGQEFTAFKFTLDDKGKVLKINKDKELLIGAGSVYDISGDGPDSTALDALDWFGDWDEAW
tara:strand:+ start:1538 stop:2233 length:696 start_codon:yes stop_codon:yes gene_type:complete